MDDMNEKIGRIKTCFVKCPKHGEHHNTITSNVKGYEGVWCQLCWIETLGEPLPFEYRDLDFGVKHDGNE